MNEMELPAARAEASESAGPASAGRMLRQAREAQGLPIAALAASIKVSVRKLELLEADRFDELPDATFTRALAQTVCRSLKLDAAPLLALLPPARGHRIEQVSEGLNAPFRDRSPRLDSLAVDSLLKAAWAPVLFLVLAALVYYTPAGFVSGMVASVSDMIRTARQSSGPAGTDMAASAPPVLAAEAPPQGDAPAPAAAVEPVFAAAPPADSASVAVSAAATSPSPGPLQLRATAESWIEVKDSRDKVLLSRSLQPGETVTLDGVLPMRVKIGNAAVTEVRLRGELVDIAPMTSENIARMELK